MKASVSIDREVSVFITKDTPISGTVEKVQNTFMSIVGQIPRPWTYDHRHETHHLKLNVGTDEEPWQVTQKVRTALEKLREPVAA